MDYYIWLEPIFLGPDWNPTTHMTWQTSTASDNSPKTKDRTFLKRFAKKIKKKVQNPYSGTWISTREPGSVLGNLDLNKTLLGDPYSGTWTRTRLCTHFVFPVLVYVLKLRSWPNIDGTYGM